ncbi:MAG: cytidylate kinase-like family protein [Muribaculaceae bacterium]
MSQEANSIHLPPGAVIVIGRQFGSGGRKIGKGIAKRLGIPYYDKALLSKAAESLGFAPEIFAAADEKKPSPFRSLLQATYGIGDNFHATSICGEKLYTVQSDVIRRICDKGPCVIVGRTADHVLRNRAALISVFIHSPIEKRVARIVMRSDCANSDSAAEMARKHDHDREQYYNYFTGRQWGKASNYHLTIDSSIISEEDAIDFIVGFVKSRWKELTQE